jgi:glutamate synthase (NADPH) large chain
MASAHLQPGPGLYDSSQEHDACGVGFIADLSGERRHDTVARALTVLRNLEHRGAQGADPDTGDGAGIITQMPDAFLRAVTGFELPATGHYAAGLAFLAPDADRQAVRAIVSGLAADEGLAVLGWRDVPHDPARCGAGARAVLPELTQLFVAGLRGESGLDLDRKAYCLRKRVEHDTSLYLASLSSSTLVYKGMLTALQLGDFFPDLTDERFASAIALVHSRFSTNTFPSWPLAHPYRLVAHNGEINTIRGNRNWMRAREAQLDTTVFGTDASGRGIERLLPIFDDNIVSDSASFDACLELLHLGGRSLPHAVLMMIPEPWERHREMDASRHAFYRFHASLMEPWDGPALIAFTDGTLVGAVLDRNGLRPGRYWVTSDGLVVLASEVGVLDLDPATVVRKGRLQPGRIFLADVGSGRIIEDEEVKAELAAEHPYADWLHAGMLHLNRLPERHRELPDSQALLVQQQQFGYT